MTNHLMTAPICSVPVEPGQKDIGEFRVTVKDESPVWVHCEQKGHCGAGKFTSSCLLQASKPHIGMVFAINPPAEGPKSFAEFKKLAIATNGTATTTTVPPTSTYYGKYSNLRFNGHNSHLYAQQHPLPRLRMLPRAQAPWNTKLQVSQYAFPKDAISYQPM